MISSSNASGRISNNYYNYNSNNNVIRLDITRCSMANILLSLLFVLFIKYLFLSSSSSSSNPFIGDGHEPYPVSTYSPHTQSANIYQQRERIFRVSHGFLRIYVSSSKDKRIDPPPSVEITKSPEIITENRAVENTPKPVEKQEETTSPTKNPTKKEKKITIVKSQSSYRPPLPNILIGMNVYLSSLLDKEVAECIMNSTIHIWEKASILLIPNIKYIKSNMESKSIEQYIKTSAGGWSLTNEFHVYLIQSNNITNKNEAKMSSKMIIPLIQQPSQSANEACSTLSHFLGYSIGRYLGLNAVPDSEFHRLCEIKNDENNEKHQSTNRGINIMCKYPTNKMDAIKSEDISITRNQIALSRVSASLLDYKMDQHGEYMLGTGTSFAATKLTSKAALQIPSCVFLPESLQQMFNSTQGKVVAHRLRFAVSPTKLAGNSVDVSLNEFRVPIYRGGSVTRVSHRKVKLIGDIIQRSYSSNREDKTLTNLSSNNNSTHYKPVGIPTLKMIPSSFRVETPEVAMRSNRHYEYDIYPPAKFELNPKSSIYIGLCFGPSSSMVAALTNSSKIHEGVGNHQPNIVQTKTSSYISGKLKRGSSFELLYTQKIPMISFDVSLLPHRNK